MATLNASKWGWLGYTAALTHSTAIDATTATVGASNTTTDRTQAVSYVAVISGRGSSFNIYRTFYYFDTSSINSTVTSCDLKIEGITNGSARSIVLESTAFGGGGGSNLTYGDYNKVTWATTYSSVLNTWSTSGVNTFTLNATALSDMETQNYLILSVLEYNNDYLDTAATSSTTLTNGIKFSNSTTRGYLDYTLATSGPANISSFNKVSSASLSQINSVSYNGIDEINTVS